MGRLRLDILITGIIGAIIGSLIVTYTLLSQVEKFVPKNETITNTTPGTEILSSLHCHQGEFYRSVMKGVEDDYAFGNPETSQEHPRLSVFPGASVSEGRLRDYDERGHDKILADYFEIPANISRGIFVIKLKVTHPETNDYLYVGDFLDRDPEQSMLSPHAFKMKIKDLANLPGWKKDGELYSINFSDLEFMIEGLSLAREHKTLLDYIQNAEGESLIDIKVADDTIVDFSGVAFCEKPKGRRGLSLSEYISLSGKPDQISFLTCSVEVTQKNCNPYYGDTLCSTDLPVACFQDLGLEKPDYLPARSGRLAWSGGKMNYTRPVRGDRFETVSDVNNFCRQEFGAEWRVANFHDGNNFNIVSLRNGPLPSDRVWIDIKDQKEATCWSR